MKRCTFMFLAIALVAFAAPGNTKTQKTEQLPPQAPPPQQPTAAELSSAIDAKNMFDPIEGPYAGPNTRLGLATVILWHSADHYGQMVLYLRLNDIVPPASRANPPELKTTY